MRFVRFIEFYKYKHNQNALEQMWWKQCLYVFLSII